MSKILILPSWKKSTCQEIVKNFSKNKYEFTFGKYKEIIFVFKDGQISINHDGIDLREFDYVWLSSMWSTRDVAYSIDQYLNKFNVKHSKVESSTSKITDQVLLTLEGILTPDTWYKPGSSIKYNLEEIEKLFSYPMILKDKFGSKGSNVMLIKDRKDLRKIYRESKKSLKCLIQGFISNDYEWGVIVSNGKVVSVEKKFAAQGEYRNNAHLGGAEEFIKKTDTPKYIQDLSISTAAILGLNWCRVDIMEDTESGRFYVLEVNRFPGITIDSSEVEAAQKFLEFEI